MGLRDNYTPTSVPQPGAGPGDQTRTPEASATRDAPWDLAALRARLARNGGVNPPEAEIPNDALDRTTRETPDGGAEPIQLTPACAAGLVAELSKLPAPVEDAGTAAPQEQPAASLSRGQKAAATRAANKARTVYADKSASSSSETASVATPDADSSDTVYAYDLSAFSLEQLLREVVKRVS